MESKYSGRLSRVSSPFVMIPSSRSLLDKWNQSGLQENVFGINFLRLTHPEDIFNEFNLTTCKEESHSSSSSSTSSLSPTVSEIQTREREDRIESDISPVQVSKSVDDRSGRPDDTQSHKLTKTN